MAGPRRRITKDLRALALDCGVLLEYKNAEGSRRHASRDAVVAILESLGYADAGSDPAAHLAERRRVRGEQMLEPVVVIEAGTDAVVHVTVGPRDRRIDCVLDYEDGGRHEWSETAASLAPPRPLATGSPRSGVGALAIPVPVPAGYHTLTLRSGRRRAMATMLARPPGGARGRFGEQWRAFGVTAPLFTLHSDRSWGCGDLGDLDVLGEFAASQHASVVSTLPLLSGFGPASYEASPYLPVSRRFWHERWIDIDQLLDLGHPEHMDGLVRDARAIAEAAAGQAGLFDGAEALRAKHAVIRELADALGDAATTRGAAFQSFLDERPETVEYARFRAAGDRFGIDWARWPRAMRGGAIAADEVDQSAERHHAFAQWILHEQMTRVAERCERRGQVLSLDLPLGVHPLGFDIWRHQDQFVQGVSVGAPPDRFFPRGQGWSFPPSHPDAVRSDGHHQFREAIVHHLNVAGMLRIDHFLGLQRLFWIPDGFSPKQGVYVSSPLEELMAVIAIEAQRHRAEIVGEDLGTVDEGVRRAMVRDGIRRTYVTELGFDHHGEGALTDPPSGSVASFSTHDLPTFAGWWEERDIDERVALHQVGSRGASTMRSARRTQKLKLAALVPGLAQDGVLPAEPPIALLTAVHERLARSDAGLVIAQLDDLLLELDAVNLPGTSYERPNWQRQTAVPLERLGEDVRLQTSIEPLRSLRGGDEPAGRGGRAVSTRCDVSKFNDVDDYLFNEGRHFRLYEKLGAHQMSIDGATGTYFAVWAPNAAWVEVIGDFNDWNGTEHPLSRHGQTGIWEGFVPGVGTGVRYKFRIESLLGGDVMDKADPFARQAEDPPRTASVTTELHHRWADDEWMETRSAHQSLQRPISIYELQLESWRRVPEEGNRPLTYGEVAPHLIDHVHRHGFTHVEFLPVMEHPFSGSWGYQVTGFFAPTARYGNEEDFAALVDALHQAGIGVLLDWVPAHFPSDAFALARFDGTHLYEHADERQGVHPDWNSLIFNYGRNEVRSFLVSSACYWLDRFHIDGLRFDAVASLLYLDYSRKPGEWVPNRNGGRENLDAIEFLRSCNDEIHRSLPGTITIAEESTSWPGVTAPLDEGGLGFDYKWDLGWMHDTLDYLGKDPIHRSWHHDQLTFRSLYAHSEHFVLPLSHDEVVHGKGSLLGRMSGDEWQRFANVRLLFGFQLAQPGKKLLFMGDEFAQRGEWDHSSSIDWHLLEQAEHRGVAELVARVNRLYAAAPALHSDNLSDSGFAWIDGNDREQSVLCIERHDGKGTSLVIVLNATPEPRERYRVGMPHPGRWSVLLNSDEVQFGGSGYPVVSDAWAAGDPCHGRSQSAELTLPPLGFLVLGHRGD